MVHTTPSSSPSSSTPPKPQLPLKLPKEVTALALHPSDRNLLLTASEDHSLRLHDLSTGRPLLAIVGLPTEVAALVFEFPPSSPEQAPSKPPATPLASAPSPPNVANADEDGSASWVDKPTMTSLSSWGRVWIACGRDLHLISLSKTPFVRPFAQAVERSVLSVASDDVNALSLSDDGASLAWCADDGKAGLVDLRTLNRRIFKGKHTNIAGSIAFLPGRPDIVVSTSYDSSLKIWQVSTGAVMDTHWIVPSPSSTSPLSMSPNFPLSLTTTFSPFLQETLIAIGTADGAVWLSVFPLLDSTSETYRGDKVGGESEKERKKRLKGKWRPGFVRAQVASGPVVGVAFLPSVSCSPSSSTTTTTPAAPSSPSSYPSNPYPSLLTLTHLGKLSISSISLTHTKSETVPPPSTTNGNSKKTKPTPSAAPSTIVEDTKMEVALVERESWQTERVAKSTALIVEPFFAKEGEEEEEEVVVEVEEKAKKWRVSVGGMGEGEGVGWVESWIVAE